MLAPCLRCDTCRAEIAVELRKMIAGADVMITEPLYGYPGALGYLGRRVRTLAEDLEKGDGT